MSERTWPVWWYLEEQLEISEECLACQATVHIENTCHKLGAETALLTGTGTAGLLVLRDGRRFRVTVEALGATKKPPGEGG